MSSDDHFYEIQNELSRVVAEKDTLEKVYQALISDHRNLQNNLVGAKSRFPSLRLIHPSKDEALSEKADIGSRLREIELRADEYRNNKTDALMRAEIDGLRAEMLVFRSLLRIVS